MDAADRPGRVIVGVDTGLAGLQALRVAVTEARVRGAALHAVRTWSPTPPPPGRPTGLPGRDLPPADPGPWHPQVLAAGDPDELAAVAVIVEAFADTIGGEPADLDVHLVVLPDAGGRVLVDYACRNDDLLVVGAARRSRWRRPWGGSTVRCCVTRAVCPVLVVPPPPLARGGSPRALLRELRREIDELAGPGPDG
ncbi:MAG: universal stress protein [Micromonosporaceae bacterium]|nr:universal stress protein [Micromonosporaceae bacterium]